MASDGKDMTPLRPGDSNGKKQSFKEHVVKTQSRIKAIHWVLSSAEKSTEFAEQNDHIHLHDVAHNPITLQFRSRALEVGFLKELRAGISKPHSILFTAACIVMLTLGAILLLQAEEPLIGFIVSAIFVLIPTIIMAVFTHKWGQIYQRTAHIVLPVYLTSGFAATLALRMTGLFEADEDEEELRTGSLSAFPYIWCLFVATSSRAITNIPIAFAWIALYLGLAFGLPEVREEAGHIFGWVLLQGICVLVGFMFSHLHEAVRRDLYLHRTLAERKEQLLAVRLADVRKAIQNILPESVTLRLMQGEKEIADEIDNVAVLFVEVKGLGDLAESDQPFDTLRRLSKVFDKLDELVQSHGAEKIKTNGGVYLVTMGAPTPHEKPAKVLASLALTILNSVSGRVKSSLTTLLSTHEFMTHKSHVEVRCGLHVGPVVAGVIGFKTLQYDVWGDTVNMASRLESNAPPNIINCSQEVYDLLHESFEFAQPLELELKGKGMVRTYPLVCRKVSHKFQPVFKTKSGIRITNTPTEPIAPLGDSMLSAAESEGQQTEDPLQMSMRDSVSTVGLDLSQPATLTHLDLNMSEIEGASPGTRRRLLHQVSELDGITPDTRRRVLDQVNEQGGITPGTRQRVLEQVINHDASSSSAVEGTKASRTVSFSDSVASAPGVERADSDVSAGAADDGGRRRSVNSVNSDGGDDLEGSGSPNGQGSDTGSHPPPAIPPLVKKSSSPSAERKDAASREDKPRSTEKEPQTESKNDDAPASLPGLLSATRGDRGVAPSPVPSEEPFEAEPVVIPLHSDSEDDEDALISVQNLAHSVRSPDKPVISRDDSTRVLLREFAKISVADQPRVLPGGVDDLFKPERDQFQELMLQFFARRKLSGWTKEHELAFAEEASEEFSRQHKYLYACGVLTFIVFGMVDLVMEEEFNVILPLIQYGIMAPVFLIAVLASLSSKYEQVYEYVPLVVNACACSVLCAHIISVSGEEAFFFPAKVLIYIMYLSAWPVRRVLMFGTMSTVFTIVMTVLVILKSSTVGFDVATAVASILFFAFFGQLTQFLFTRAAQIRHLCTLRNRKHAAMLQNESKLVQNLLTSCIPETIIPMVLKRQPGDLLADRYQKASVLFCDIKGFTSLSSRMSASDTVSMLSWLFEAFDMVANSLGLVKIKTLGDCFVCAAGVPTPREDHAIAMIEMGLQMQQAVCRYNTLHASTRDINAPVLHHPEIKFRFGVASGPVMAGVMGQTRWAFDVWGSTVIRANELEATGEPDMVHIDEPTYYAIRDAGMLNDFKPEPADPWVDASGKSWNTWLIAPQPEAPGLHSMPTAQADALAESLTQTEIARQLDSKS